MVQNILLKISIQIIILQNVKNVINSQKNKRMKKILFDKQSPINRQVKTHRKSLLISQFQSISLSVLKNLKDLSGDKCVINIFKSYQKQIQTLINYKVTQQQFSNDFVQEYNYDNLGYNDHTIGFNYLCLRKTWQGIQQQSSITSQDRIDKINKTIAGIRKNINYDLKKEKYLIQKEENNILQSYQKAKFNIQLNQLNDEQFKDKKKSQFKEKTRQYKQNQNKQNQILLNQYLYTHPTFQKIKCQLQTCLMQKEQYLTKMNNYKQTTSKTLISKKHLQENLKKLKLKNKQTQIKYIQISKKNILLEEQLKLLKSISTTDKLKQSKVKQGISILSSRTSFTLENSCHFIETQLLQTIPILQIQNNTQEEQIIKKSKNFTSNSLIKNNINLNSLNNEQKPNNLLIYNYASVNKLPQDKNKYSHPRYIKQDQSIRRSILSSAKSINLREKTSITKSKFERTNNITTNLHQFIESDGKCNKLKKKTIDRAQRLFKSP